MADEACHWASEKSIFGEKKSIFTYRTDKKKETQNHSLFILNEQYAN